MKKLVLFVLIAVFSLNYTAKADEGMWLPFLIKRLNYADMQKMGLKLTAEEIYSVNNSSIKDAIIQFGNGCTGEIISSEGLVLTNHHCGYGQIQSHSTVDHNYLKDGFWAYSKEEELPNPGLTASFLVRMEDVTQKVLADVTDKMSEGERGAKIKAVIGRLIKEATEGNGYRAEIKDFFDGNEYYMFVYETFRDVRLVGAPPSAIGKFGGDTDNWMWPRHTGDFSMFRIYSAPDGSPADYSKDNVPLKPKHFLPVNVGGIKKGDFSMIMGYPGGTDRYMTSYGINLNLEQTYPCRIDIRRKKLDIIGAAMDKDEAVKIQYASKYSRIANYWKNFIGMSRGLKRLKVADKKMKLEQQFLSWSEQFPSRKEKYGNALNDVKAAYQQIEKYNYARYYFIEAIYLGPEALNFSRQFEGLVKLLQSDNPDQEKINKMKEGLKKSAEKHFKDYYQPVDKELWAEMMKMYFENLPADQQPEYLKANAKKYKNDFYKWAEKVYAKSVFVDKAKVMELIDNPNAKTIEKDPVFQAQKAFFSKYFEIAAKMQEANTQLNRGRRLFVDGIRKMQPEKSFYPDANFTLRLTYGRVLDYYPADAVHYNWYTTLEGIMMKEDPTNDEFIVPEKLKQLYEAKDYGQYGENGKMKVCFLTDHDITGGNSGSPVIDAEGNLIGLAFDGNWEAMSGDIAFEPELQRTINVDIRYVLFIIDKYAGAKNLINEMKLVKPMPTKQDVKKDAPKQEEIKESDKG
jgi:hypothetical protein